MVEINPDNVQSILAGLVAKTRHLDLGGPNDSAAAESGAAGSTTSVPDDVPGMLGVWQDVVAGISAAPLARLTDRMLTDQVLEADRLRRASDAAYLRLVAEVDARKAAPASAIGAASTANLLTAGCGHSPSRAKSDVDAARALYSQAVESSALTPTVEPGPLAGMAGLLESGQVRVEHVTTAIRTLERIPERLATDETSDTIVGFFTEHAPTSSPRTLGRLAEELLGQLSPPDDDLYDPEAFNRRSLRVSTDMLGMVHGNYQLDPHAGAEFSAMIDSLSGPRPDQKDRQGNVVAHDDRTPAQRRADALNEIIHTAASNLGIRLQTSSGDNERLDADDESSGAEGERADQGLFELVTGEGGDVSGCESAPGTSRAGRFRPGRRQPRIVIVTTEDQVRAKRDERAERGDPNCRFRPVDPSTSRCQQTGQVGAGMLALTACDALFERVVLDKKGAVLDLGQAARLASPAQRRALEVRDHGCVFAGCDRPASWCDAHHVLWFSRGGPTTMTNMVLLCPMHHALIHTGQWEVCLVDGIPYTRPAPGTKSGMIFGTATNADGWIHNTYFEALDHARHTGKSIRDSAGHDPPGDNG